MIELDGSYGEGGGQILRTSLSLALLTGRSFHLANVRAGRSKPGLQPQHLMSVRAASTIGQAKARGASRGSTDLVFEPGQVVSGKYHFAIGTAGATSLVLHTIYLPLALAAKAPSDITLQGGTHVRASPPFDFLHTTWLAYMEHMGLPMKLKLIRPGFYPRGGGEIKAHVEPASGVHGLIIKERGQVTTANGFSAVAGLPESIAARQARRAVSRLRHYGLQADIQVESWSGGPGTVLAIILDTPPAPTLFVGLGERGKPAERVADEAVDQAISYLEAEPAALDPHSADQLVLPLALADEPSEFSVSQVTAHLLTNVAIIGRFVEREIVCDGAVGQPGVVRILGKMIPE